MPWRVALDERGRLLVAEDDGNGSIRVVEASPVPPAWMDTVEQEATAQQDETAMKTQAVTDYGKLLEEPERADVVLVVDGERFPAHRLVLAA